MAFCRSVKKDRLVIKTYSEITLLPVIEGKKIPRVKITIKNMIFELKSIRRA